MLGIKYSFRLISSKNPDNIRSSDQGSESSTDKNNTEKENKKRSFLKLAGVVGVGAMAATLVPRKAEALVFGSTPTSNNVGLKDASNSRVNPATQETLLAIKAQSDLLTFDSGSNPANLKVNISAGSVGVKNASAVTINPATEESLVTIKTQANKLTFDGSNNLLTSTILSASSVGVKDSLDNRVNPSQDDSVILLRRIVKVMESQATVDSSNRQKVTLDAITTALTLSTITTVTTVSTVSSVTNVAALDGYNRQMFQDVARNAYANGIRQNLSFS